MSKKILVSGIQSSGALHIGNYFGAIKQNIELGNSGEYDSYVFIADYHSMTSLTDSKTRIENTFDAACVYLAFGLDTEKVTLFKQSDVIEHTELSWILSTLTPMPMLELAHAYKDKNKIYNFFIDGVMVMSGDISMDAMDLFGRSSQVSLLPGQHILSIRNNKNEIIFSNEVPLDGKINLSEILNNKIINNAGLFTYPVLMAADILMYDADLVPVGRDQEQHVEIARELAGKYNRAYVETFKMPQAYIKKEVATVPGVDGTKMSKSKGNTIPLFATDEEIGKAVMSIVTDSARPEDKKNPDENNIYQIHKLFLTEDEDTALRARYTDGGLGYKEAKDMCRDTIINFIAPARERYNYYQESPEEVWDILREGGEKAKAKARNMMDKIRKDTGLTR